MEHCRWWSQCKTFHEYKCFELDWPSRDCDCACVYVCVLFFSALHVCQHSAAAAAALHLLAPAEFTTVLRVKHTHKSDIEMCRRPFWADSESCLSRRRENEPTWLQRRPQLHLTPPPSPSHFVCFSLLSSSLSELLHPPPNKKNPPEVSGLPQRHEDGEGERLKHTREEISHKILISTFL